MDHADHEARFAAWLDAMGDLITTWIIASTPWLD
jgi:hypothetical protein